MDKNLYEVLENTFNKIIVNEKYTFEDVMAKEAICKKCLKSYLKEPLFEEGYGTNIKLVENRTRHSMITCLLGVYFADYLKINFRGVGGGSFRTTWLLTALYHDIGYFSEYIQDKNLVFSDIVENYLFSDVKEFKALDESVMFHTIEDIMNYDKYSRWFRINKNHVEIVDHGILGGVLSYESLLKKNSRHKNKYYYSDVKKIYLVPSLTIAQHNIFFSEDEESDKNYIRFGLRSLTTQEDRHISHKTPYLYLLCLVDTIECAKRFGSGKSSEDYLQLKTVLKKIFITSDDNGIKINCSNLAEWINKRKSSRLKKVFDSWLNNVYKLSEWTTFNVKKIDDDGFEFYIGHHLQQMSE